MSEEITIAPEVQTEPTAVPPPAEAIQTDTPTAEPITIPKSRFDEVNNQLKELRAAQEKAAKERELAERKALEEQNKFKELYEIAQQEKTAAEAKAQQAVRDSIRQRIATEAGYPKLWQRLQGDDEETIKADMDTLLESLPKPNAPSLDGNAGGRSRNGKPTLSTAQIREMAAIYNLDPNILAKQYGVSLKE